MVGVPAGYSGQGFSLRGEKGRLVLPPDFRNAFADAGDDRILCLTKHDRWNCLIGFGLSRTQTFEDQLLREEERALRLGQEFDYDMRAQQLWGFTKLPFDSSGRFVLPEHLAELGRLKEAVYFNGGGSYFALWSPDELYAMPKGFETAQANCRQLEADARGKRK
ncbi:division/cell wall cluster transcriptional repressor MraZ [Croceibacterium sp. TMG7-5b_MA50]|uniref:division/cell wall cluster transcriptional repressor MraZ n=1 Tax=Croceibacterium sp. TMG7-5b_MA50 TaxID=3121290 RepID=UPI00322163DE